MNRGPALGSMRLRLLLLIMCGSNYCSWSIVLLTICNFLSQQGKHGFEPRFPEPQPNPAKNPEIQREKRMRRERVFEPQIRSHRSAQISGEQDCAQNRGLRHDIERRASQQNCADSRRQVDGPSGSCEGIDDWLRFYELARGIKQHE